MSSCGQLEAPCFEDDNLSNLSNHYTNFNTAFLLTACATTTPDQTCQEKKKKLGDSCKTSLSFFKPPAACEGISAINMNLSAILDLVYNFIVRLREMLLKLARRFIQDRSNKKADNWQLNTRWIQGG